MKKKIKRIPEVANGSYEGKHLDNQLSRSKGSKITLLLRTTTYKVDPEKKRLKVSRITGKEHNRTTWQRTIDQGNQRIEQKLQYFKISKDMLRSDDRMREFIKSKSSRHLKGFMKGKQKDITQSVQLIQGKITDRYKARVTPESKVSQSIKLHSVRKVKKGLKRLKVDIETQFFNNQEYMLRDMPKLSDYGLVTKKDADVNERRREKEKARGPLNIFGEKPLTEEEYEDIYEEEE